MLLKLKNVGRLKSAEVKINGITVICGNNNTGKSTVGKILYCIYDSLHELQKSIRDDKIETLKNSVAYAVFLREKGFDFRTPDKIMPHIQKAVDNDGTAGAIIDALRKLYGGEISEAGIKELYERIELILKMSLNDMASNFITRRLDAEFGQRLGNVNRPKIKSSVELKIKDDSIVFHASGSKNKLTLENFFSLHKNIIYIDDPFVMDEINAQSLTLSIVNQYKHRSRLIEMLRKGREIERTSVEEIIGDRKLEGIITAINSISDGELVVEDGEFTYKHTGLQKSLSLQSVSTGIKTFIIIKKLLQDGMLEENGIIVFDEPEVHLHPEWQIKLAEIIVMLHKAYGLNIVLTTHSMEFLIAIDYFSQQYGIEGICSYYLAELEKSKSADDFPCAVVHEMTSDKEKLYASISRPFLSLYNQMS